MKEAKVIQARSFKCLDNPSNTLVFVKYYATGEKTVAYGCVIPSSFFRKVESDMSQCMLDPKYTKPVRLGKEGEQYSLNYGSDKDMTWSVFLKRLYSWAKKTKPLEGSGYEEAFTMDNVPVHTVDILKHSEDYKFKQFKAA